MRFPRTIESLYRIQATCAKSHDTAAASATNFPGFIPLRRPQKFKRKRLPPQKRYAHYNILFRFAITPPVYRVATLPDFHSADVFIKSNTIAKQAKTSAKEAFDYAFFAISAAVAATSRLSHSGSSTSQKVPKLNTNPTIVSLYCICKVRTVVLSSTHSVI